MKQLGHMFNPGDLVQSREPGVFNISALRPHDITAKAGAGLQVAGDVGLVLSCHTWWAAGASGQYRFYVLLIHNSAFVVDECELQSWSNPAGTE
jgi:hypothetical protein